MDPIKALLLGVVAPGALALVLVAALRRPWSKARGDVGARAPWASALAVALGYALAFGLVLDWPSFLPVDVTQVSPYVALALAPLAFLGRGRALATGVIGALVGLFVAWPLFRAEPLLLVVFAALVALTFVVLERGLDRGLERSDPRGGALATIVLASGAAAAVLFSDTASLAQVTGALAAAVGAIFTLGLVWPAAADLRRASPVLAGVLATNLWSAGLYANGRVEVITLLALAPLAVVLGAWWSRARAARSVSLATGTSRTSRTRAVLTVARPALFVALPVAVAAFLAGRTYFAEPAPSASHDDASAGSSGGASVHGAKATANDDDDPNYGY